MSSLVEHARRELALTGEDQDFTDGLCQVVQSFANMGHSGGSASIAMLYLERLLRYQPLSDLTDDPVEWIDRHAEGLAASPWWQSVRNPDAMSHDGGKTYWLVSERDAAGSLETTPIHTTKAALPQSPIAPPSQNPDCPTPALPSVHSPAAYPPLVAGLSYSSQDGNAGPMIRRPKRSDLTTLTVLQTIRDHRFDSYDVLCETMPPKVVLAALERECGRGRLDYGVSITYCWLTPEGLGSLNAAEGNHPMQGHSAAAFIAHQGDRPARLAARTEAYGAALAQAMARAMAATLTTEDFT